MSKDSSVIVISTCILNIKGHPKAQIVSKSEREKILIVCDKQRIYIGMSIPLHMPANGGYLASFIDNKAINITSQEKSTHDIINDLVEYCIYNYDGMKQFIKTKAKQGQYYGQYESISYKLFAKAALS